MMGVARPSRDVSNDVAANLRPNSGHARQTRRRAGYSSSASGPAGSNRRNMGRGGGLGRVVTELRRGNSSPGGSFGLFELSESMAALSPREIRYTLSPNDFQLTIRAMGLAMPDRPNRTPENTPRLVLF